MRSIAIAVVASLLACNAGMQMNQTNVIVGTSGDGYAVMNGVPVVGGELRLVAPQFITIEDEQRQVVGFPLKHTAVTAKVGGMMAVYELVQTFENPFTEPIEAVYVFPLGDDSAVSGYEIIIGERTITGEIQTREQARETYEQARHSGHTAGMIEQNKTNIFTQRIANIAPRETIKIKLRYTELLDYDNGSYSMVVPLTVGPRYLPRGNAGSSPIGSHEHDGTPREGSIGYIDATRASSTVSFRAEIDAGVPIYAVESKSHDIVSNQVTPTRMSVALADKNEIPNHDLIVKFKTAGPETTIGLLTHRMDNDGYFLLAVQPKAQYRTGDIRPREVVLVIDKSGSMDGAPLDQAKTVASAIIQTLRYEDTVNVIAFASGVESMASRAIRGDDAGKREALEYVRAIQAGGGTEMEMSVVSMLTSTPGADRIRVVYFITDGFVGNDDVVIGAAKKYLGTNRIFTVGIGSSPNRALLDRLALAGRGFASYVTLVDDAKQESAELVLKSAYPYMTDVEIDWGGLRVEELTPHNIPDVYAGQPLVISGRYRTPGAATINVKATVAGRRTTIPIAVQLPAYNDFEPTASLWARRKIEALNANKDIEDVRRQVTELGMRFHLVTDYTSFVAVDRSRTVSNGQPRTIEQPSIVPEGVNPTTSVGSGPVATSTPTPSRSSSRSSDDGCTFFCGGGGGGGWGGGGLEDTDWYILAFAFLGVLWLIVRRFV